VSVSAGFHEFEKILAMYIYVKIVTRSRNHCCRGVAVSIKYSGPVPYLTDMKIASFANKVYLI